jgi:hypothetical protein
MSFVVNRCVPLAMSITVALALTSAAAQERTTKVVPERPARVFVMAGYDADCRIITPVYISIDQQPGQGSVTFRDSQTTTIPSSNGGKCVGARVTGTGIYYTARVGASGSDTFSISARIGNGDTVTRTFTVQIADD